MSKTSRAVLEYLLPTGYLIAPGHVFHVTILVRIIQVAFKLLLVLRLLIGGLLDLVFVDVHLMVVRPFVLRRVAPRPREVPQRLVLPPIILGPSLEVYLVPVGFSVTAHPRVLRSLGAIGP